MWRFVLTMLAAVLVASCTGVAPVAAPMATDSPLATEQGTSIVAAMPDAGALEIQEYACPRGRTPMM